MDIEHLEKIPPWDWPEDAGEALMRALRDRRGTVSGRILAAALAGDLVVMDEEMAELLLSILEDAGESEEVRAKAAISLGPVLEETENEGFDDPFSEPPIAKETFDKIQATLRKLYFDERVPKHVRRRILEASVRATQDWHADAIRSAYSRGEEDWKLTSVFGMRYVPGFDDQIVEALRSSNSDIHYEAVCAAGTREVDAAWPHVAYLLAAETTPKPLLLAAIEAAATIRPKEAQAVIGDLLDSEDEEIADAASEALMMAEQDFDEVDDDNDWPDGAGNGHPKRS